MTFGTKFADRHGTEQVIEISVSNIQDQIVALLYATKKLPERQDVLSINLDDIFGKKRTDVIKIGVKVKKEE